MSFQIDVNPDSPCTTLDSFVSVTRAYVPKFKQDSQGAWLCTNVQQGSRSNKPLANFNYSLGSSTSNIYIYFNKALIGVHDYPDLVNSARYIWADIASTEPAAVTVQGLWLGLLVLLFGWEYVSASISAAIFGPSAWQISAKVQPTPTVIITPGIKEFEALWVEKFSNINANVQSGPSNTLQTTNITPNYQVVGPGSSGSFQGDFNAKLDQIINALKDAMSGDSLGASAAETATATRDLVDSLAMFAVSMGVALGVDSGGTPVSHSLSGMKTQLDALEEGGLKVLIQKPASADVDFLAELILAVEAQADETHGLPSAMKAQLADLVDEKIAPLKTDVTTSLDGISGKVNELATKMGEVKATLQTSLSQEGIADVLAALPTGTTELALISTAIAAEATMQDGHYQTMEEKFDRALLLTGGERDQINGYLAELAQLLGFSLPTLPAGSTIGAVVGLIGSILGRMNLQNVKNVSDVLNNIKNLLFDPTVRLKTEVEDALIQSGNALERGLLASNTAYLQQFRDALGWHQPPLENTFDESLRGLLAHAIEDLDGLIIRNPETGETLSITEAISTMDIALEWKKGDLIWTFQ